MENCQTLYNDNTLILAREIVEDFLTDIDRVWKSYKDNLVTDFRESGQLLKEYYSSHDVALVLRASLYALKSGVVDKELSMRLINKCVLSLNYNFNKKSKIHLK